MSILEISNLHKKFGKQEVLSDLNMSVPENSIFGFAGPNGAGKTTTMKMVVGLLKPDSGNITVCGKKVLYGQNTTNRYIGYLPDVPEFYNYMNAAEYLRLCGDITGMTQSDIKKRGGELLTLVGLPNNKKKLGGYSRGMKQRLGIAQALLHEPKLLLCDEPTSALDPIGRKEILDILLSIKGKTTVVFSTHVLSDVERICDQIAVLHKGNIVLNGSLAEIKSHYRHNGYQIAFEQGDAEKFTALAGMKQAGISTETEGNTCTVTITDAGIKGQHIIKMLSEANITPTRFEIMEPSLENLFVEAVR